MGLRAELAREARRKSLRWLLAGFVVLLIPLSLFGLGGLVETVVTFAFVFVPLAFLPFAANLGARDRATGMAKVQATTPLHSGASLLAKLFIVLGVLAVYLAAALVVTTALLWPIFAAPSPHILGALGWGALVGSSAGVLGLLVGYVSAGRPTAAVGAGSLLAILSGLLGANAQNLLSLAGEGAARTVLEFVLELSPVTWSNLSSSGAITPVAPPTQAVGAVVGSTVAIALALFVVDRLQDSTGWRPRLPKPLLGLLVLLLVVGAAIPAIAGDPSQPESEAEFKDTASTGGIEVGFGGDGPESAAQSGGVIDKGMYVLGPANRTVELRVSQVTSPTLEIVDVRPEAKTVTLESSGSSGDEGRAGVEFVLTYRIQEPERGHLLRFDLTVDGEPVQVSTKAAFFDWEVSMTKASIASLASASLPLLAGGLYARRWDSWS